MFILFLLFQITVNANAATVIENLLISSIMNCGDFGFIIRYPAGKENITGFNYEPWHIRYVGMPHSKIITEGGITLEEYIDSLEIDNWYSYNNYLISRQNPDNLKIPSTYKNNDIKVSPDNTGYYIITINTDKLKGA